MQNNPFADIALDGSLLLAAPIALLAGLISLSLIHISEPTRPY